MTYKKGFTLVEIMVSVAILSIGLVLILQGLAFSLNALQIARDSLEATQAAENKMVASQIQADEDWDKFKFGLKEQFEFQNLDCDWRVELEDFQWQTEEPPENYADLKLISADLLWQEGRRKGKVALVSLIREVKPENE